MVREPERARALLGSSIELFRADFADSASVEAALRDIERVLLLAPNTPEQVAWETAFIAAARRAGVQHVVEFSGLGADMRSSARISRSHGEIEAVLERSGMAYTHLRPNTFMQNFLAAAPSIAAHGTLALPMADFRVSFVDVRDVAEIAARALTEDGHAGRSYTITGPAALSHAEAAERLGAVLGKRVRLLEMPATDYAAAMASTGTPLWLLDALLEMRTALETAGAIVTDAVREVTGSGARPFDAFARDYAGAFART
jgi:uncharacterized protein YbjT (DUF2867 family)